MANIIKYTGGSGHGDNIIPTRALVHADTGATVTANIDIAFDSNFTATKVGHIIGFDGTATAASVSADNGAGKGTLQFILSNEDLSGTTTPDLLRYQVTIFSGQSVDFSELGGALIRDNLDTTNTGTEFRATHIRIINSNITDSQALIELWS